MRSSAAVRLVLNMAMPVLASALLLGMPAMAQQTEPAVPPGSSAAPEQPAERIAPVPAPQLEVGPTPVSPPPVAPERQGAPAGNMPGDQDAPDAVPPVPGTATEIAPQIVPPGAGLDAQPGEAAGSEELPSVRAGTLPHNLSPWGMFLQADWIVKGVMIGLAFASLVTWTVWLAKGLELMGASNRARTALKAITRSRTLDDAIRALEGKRGAGVLLVKAAEEEVQLSIGALDHADGTGLKERVSSRLSRLTAAAGRRLSRGTGLLATIGSTAPFVGLFGTVWGIMNAFIGISEAQTINLAVVAPGIAEALLATALGLVAAIPAVVIYNVFARSIAGYRQLLADAAAGVERLVSRDLDYRTVPVQSSLRTAGQRRQWAEPVAEAGGAPLMAGGIRESGGDDDDLVESHEINVTPFIDVMLVLLIIFMVAAPLATVDVNVDLPASNAQPQPRPEEPLFLTVKDDLSLSLGDDTIPREQLGIALDAQTQADKQQRIFLRADQAVAYGDLMAVMNLLRDAGYLSIALVGLETVPGAAGPPGEVSSPDVPLPVEAAPGL